MGRNIAILLVTAVVVALPFLFRREETIGTWHAGDPVLVVISPHYEAIRHEFGHAFSAWHEAHYGTPVKVDWRVIGGTSEIMRYLGGEYIASFKAWWTRAGKTWPKGGEWMLLDRRFKPDREPQDPGKRSEWELQKPLWEAFRTEDDPSAFGSGIDVFFGGGSYDHGMAAQQGLTVSAWPPEAFPSNVLATADGRELIPRERSGEAWRNDTFYGTTLSTFGICYNLDRLQDLGIPEPPDEWSDLTDPRYRGELGVADPTKSGSISKAFEMIIHEQCRRAVHTAGFTDAQATDYEQAIRAARLPVGEMPEGVPATYQTAIERGWERGLRVVQLIGANARYFTDGAGQVPIDVSAGNAAAGLVIDFYGRFQAETTRAPDGTARMVYITPRGGSSVSADPISLLRGASHRELAERFIAYVLGAEGQKLWNYRPGTPGGPIKFALRRLPIRRDMYPSDDPAMNAVSQSHAACTSDDLTDPRVDPYRLSSEFIYQPRWSAYHFSVQRQIIRAMCMDAGDELKAAWRTIAEHGGADACPRAMAQLTQLPSRPEPLTWSSALSVGDRFDDLELMREWTLFFRSSYTEARRLAEREGSGD